MAIHIRDFVGRRLHMIGIGGSSMSGLAGLLHDTGYAVSGSDNYASHHIDEVRALGIPVVIGHHAENMRDADLIVYSAAIAAENPERLEAKRAGIPEMERSTLLGQLMEGYGQAVGISGTHGKTTTTAMLAQALIHAGLEPSIHIGGDFDHIGGGTRIGARNIFIAEACEFHASFLEMRPTIAVVLNIDADHLDFYRDIDHIAEAFGRFVSLVPENGSLIGNGDDPRVRKLFQAAQCRVLSFGIGPENGMRAENIRYDGLGYPAFDLMLHGTRLAGVQLRVGGAFNILNALAALAAAHALGVDIEKAAQGISAFTGVRRRLEHTGTVDGVRLYHDYGHNPVEMKGALSVIKMQPHDRLIAVLQPHTYSRVKRLFDDYIHCADDADIILVTDIYAARESNPGDIHSGMLVDRMRAEGLDVHLTPTFDDTERTLRELWRPGDVVLTMGCGNINELNERMGGEKQI